MLNIGEIIEISFSKVSGATASFKHFLNYLSKPKRYKVAVMFFFSLSSFFSSLGKFFFLMLVKDIRVAIILNICNLFGDKIHSFNTCNFEVNDNRISTGIALKQLMLKQKARVKSGIKISNKLIRFIF